MRLDYQNACVAFIDEVTNLLDYFLSTLIHTNKHELNNIKQYY